MPWLTRIPGRLLHINALRATVPFFLIMILMVVLVTAFPEIVFYLPRMMVE